MKPRLLFPDRDADLDAELPEHHVDVVRDLGVDQLLAAMGRGDDFLTDVARRVVLASIVDPETIRYRQAILQDCLEQSDVVWQVYQLAVEAIERERHVWSSALSRSPDLILHRAVEVLGIFVDVLKRLHGLGREHAEQFGSPGFREFFAMLDRELGADYFAEVDGHLERLRFRHGVLVSAQLGQGNKGVRYVLRSPVRPQGGWLRRLTSDRPESHTLRIAPRDDAGLRALDELRGRGITIAANALAQSTDHILSFFVTLRSELGFYLAGSNLYDRLAARGEPVCMPDPVASAQPSLTCRGLYDVGLSLRVTERLVGNDADAADTALVLITGANQGGKSTFLRSIGLAHLMMQCGLFVGAESFAARPSSGLFTHFRREEDASMESGKLDEELARMSEIVDAVRPGGLVLFNESFSGTNEREGSEIGRQITRALVEHDIAVYLVTHLFDLADSICRRPPGSLLSLRADRRADGSRSFRLVPGEPLPTSYGADLYAEIFGAASDDVLADAVGLE